MREWFYGILQGVFGTLLYDVLLAGGVGILLGILKAKKEKWAGPLAYGLFGFTLILLCGFALTGKGVVSEGVAVTRSNVESTVKSWLDDFHYSIRSVNNPNAIFSLQATDSAGRLITIREPQAFERYLVLTAQVSAGSGFREMYEKLPEESRAELRDEISIELATVRIGYNVSLPDGVVLDNMVPITSNLDEDTFIRACHDTTLSGDIAAAIMDFGLRAAIMPSPGTLPRTKRPIQRR